MSEYRRAKRNVEASTGESVRIIRELQELNQSELSELTGIPQSTIERERINRVWNAPRFWPERCSVVRPYWYFLAGMSNVSQQHNIALEPTHLIVTTFAESAKIAPPAAGVSARCMRHE